MKRIPLLSVDEAFKGHSVTSVMVVRQSVGGWYFAFDASDPLGENVVQYAMRVTRGAELRVWKNVDLLFDSIANRYQVTNGKFFLEAAR